MKASAKESLDIVHELVQALQHTPLLEEAQKQEIGSYIGEIEHHILENTTPDKTYFDGLLKLIGAHDKLIRPAMQLAQLYGYLVSQ